MKIKRAFFLTLTLVFVLALVGPAAAQEGKIINIIFTQEPDNLNPFYTDMWFAGNVIELFLLPAWFIDDTLTPTPALVEEIPSVENGGVSEDGTVITLTLREGLVWSDGEPLTSSDFVFTYEMVMDEANTPTTRFPYDERVASVEAPDERTVVVTFNEPYAPWITRLFIEGILPEHVLRPVFEADGNIDNAEWNRAPTVTSGPFVFSEWETGGHMLFTRNENYYAGPAKLDGVFIRFVPDDASQVAALLNGDGDIGTFIAYPDVPQLQEAGIEIITVNSGYNETWFFNVHPERGHPALQDVNVRRALALAFNREQISEDLLLGLTFPPASFWEGSPYARPDAEPIPYDPEEAAQLLDEAGWVDSNGDGTRDKDGTELVLRYVTTTREIRVETQVVVQQAFQELGIGLELINHSSDIFFNSYGTGGPIATGNFDIAQWSTTPEGFPDPEDSSIMCSQIPSQENPEGTNWTGYCNQELDALMEEQARTTDPEARVELFHQIDEILFNDVVMVGVWHDPDLWALSSRVVDARISGADPFWNAANWDLSE
jgi:peptide/nickel transport system substrate-binding protein